MSELRKYGNLSNDGVDKNLSAFQTTETYEFTFSDLVSKCDVMRKMKRKKKRQEMTTSINWTHIGFSKK